MFTRRVTTRPPHAVPALVEPAPAPAEWERPERDYQSLVLTLRQWQMVVRPSLRGTGAAQVHLDFDARIGQAPLRDVEVTGQIEVVDAQAPPAHVLAQWQQPPEQLDGYCRLQEDDSGLLPPRLDLQLFCPAGAIDAVTRALQVGTQGGQGTVALRLDLDSPDLSGPALWQARWRHEVLRVSDWEIVSQARTSEAGLAARR